MTWWCRVWWNERHLACKKPGLIIHRCSPLGDLSTCSDPTTERQLNNNSSAVAQRGNRLATINMGRNRHGQKSGGCCAPFRGGSWICHLTQCRLGRGLPPYQVVSWSIQPFGHNTPMLQTDRQTGQTRQWSYNIEQTTCNSRPKTECKGIISGNNISFLSRQRCPEWKAVCMQELFLKMDRL